MRGFLYWSAYDGIAETLRMDAAPGRIAWGDPSFCGNALAKASRDARADPALFVQAVRQLVASAGASATCTLACADPTWRETWPGFEARRFEDRLYVTKAPQERRLAPGMRIVAVGENRVEDLLKTIGADIFGGRGTDRESWGLVFGMFDDIDVFPGDDHVERLDLRPYPVPSSERPAIELEEPSPGVALLRVGTLSDPSRLQATIGQGSALLARARRLVLDLRGCAGEADPRSWLALLPYLCDATMPARDVMGPRTLWTIYSKGNVERLVGMLSRAREADGSGGRREEADALIESVRAKGREVLEAKRATLDQRERRVLSEVREDAPSPFVGELVRVDENAPREVAVLVDETTGVGAERLAQAVMGMDRVRLVGRATPGAVDYDNYLTEEFPDVLCSFTYPISRTDGSHRGDGYALTGLPLDAHVAFTPAECTSDAVLRTALELAWE